MKTLFTKKFAVLCLSAVMSFGLCFGFTGLNPVGAASATGYDVIEIAENYTVNTEVTVSNTSDANKTVFPKEIIIGSNTANLTSVKYPDGYERGVGDSFVLNQLGLYTVTYKTSNNIYYFDSFRVFDTFANVVGDGGLQNYLVNEEVQGVTAVMEPGTQIMFNKVIDLTNIDANTGLVDLFTAQFKTKSADNEILCAYTEIILEDVINPDVFIKIVYNTTTSALYFRASTAELPEVGLAPSTSTEETLTGSEKGLLTYIDGKKYKARHGKYGRTSLGSTVDQVIRYNPVTQRLYRENPAKPHSNDELFVDLQNVDSYDNGARLFEGFPSKAVKMTVRGMEYTGAFNIHFTQIGDTKGADLVELISAGIDDVKAPSITVDYTPTEAGTVYGQFGRKFVIPTATAIDANGASNVSIKAYKNYVENSKVFVPLQDDGTLLLDEQTVYTIEYTSYDMYGNLAVETLNVVPKTATSITGYDYNFNGSVVFGANKISLVTGENCNANVFDVFTTLNKADALTLNVDVTHAGQSVFSKEYTASEIKAGNVKFDFLPVSIGDYTVTYKLGDNVEHDTFTYMVSCTSDNKVNFKEKPFLYKNYMYGMEYDVSSHVAYQFGDTLSTTPTTVEISYDDGATWKQVGETFVVGADANGEVPLTQSVFDIKFKYTSGSAVQVTDSAPIIDVRKDTSKKLSLTANKSQGLEGNVDYSKYFDLSEFEVKGNEDTKYKYVFNAKNTSGSATLKTNNPLTFNKTGEFFTELDTDADYSDFNKLTIRLVDAYDPTNVLEFYYELIQGATTIDVEGSRRYVVAEYPLFSLNPENKKSTLSFTYKVSTGRISTCGMQFNVNFYPTNNLFYVEYELGGITGENAAITLTTVSNVSLSARSVVDSAAPVLYYQSSAGIYELGSTVTIFSPQVTDFVSPYIHKGHTLIKVTKNNQTITSKEGIALDGIKNDPTKNFTIEISEVAVYKVTYLVKDSAGRESSAAYTIQGADKVDPVITLGYDFTENTIHNVTLGKPFTIDYTVTDNTSPSDACYARVVIINDLTSREVYAVEPMELAETSEDYALITDTCTITVKGMYTVYVYARDEVGNTDYAHYKLNVQ